MYAVISIHPEYAKKIYDGTKKFEFRKIVPRESLEYVYLYETAPVGAITGRISINNVLIDEPGRLWATTKSHRGITQKKFMNYYKFKELAVALSIGNAQRFSTAYMLKDFGLKTAPQSMVYLRNHNYINI